MISNEDFFPELNGFSYAKIRGSWGQNGSLSNLGKYSYASNVVSSGSVTNYLTWSSMNASTLYPWRMVHMRPLLLLPYWVIIN